MGVLVSITTIPCAANVGVAPALGEPSEALRSFVLLVVNLAGLLAGGVVTLLLTRIWARQIESGRAAFGPKSACGPEPARLREWNIRGIIPSARCSGAHPSESSCRYSDLRVRRGRGRTAR